MKKSILIGAIAALMLFAFVACNNTPAAVGEVTYIKASQTATYVEGEKATAEGFAFTGYTNMGLEVSLDPSQVEVNGSTLVAGDANTYSISYRNQAMGQVKVTAEDVTDIKIDATNVEKTYYTVVADYTYEDADARKEVSKDGLVVTAVYEGGEKVVDNEYVTLDDSTMGDWSTAKDATITVKFGGEDATFDVVLATNRVEEVELLATEDYKLFTDVEGKKVLRYATDGKDDTTGGIYMNKIMQGGEIILIATEADNIMYFSGDANDYTIASCTSIVIPENGGTITVRAKYVGTDCAVGATRTDDIAVTAEKDSVAKVEVTAVPAELENINYSEAAKLDGVTVKVTKASGATSTPSVVLKNADSEATDNYFVLSQMDLTNATVGDRISITFSGVASGKEFSKTADVLIKEATKN